MVLTNTYIRKRQPDWPAPLPHLALLLLPVQVRSQVVEYRIKRAITRTGEILYQAVPHVVGRTCATFP